MKVNWILKLVGHIRPTRRTLEKEAKKSPNSCWPVVEYELSMLALWDRFSDFQSEKNLSTISWRAMQRFQLSFQAINTWSLYLWFRKSLSFLKLTRSVRLLAGISGMLGLCNYTRTRMHRQSFVRSFAFWHYSKSLVEVMMGAFSKTQKTP